MTEGRQPPSELVAILKRAQIVLESMILSQDSGTVTIGYGNKGLRLVVNRHEKSVPLRSEGGQVISESAKN